MYHTVMKKAKTVTKGTTLFLKSVIVLVGLLVLLLCVFLLPAGIRSDNVGYYRPILIGMYFPAIPFFIALFQGFRLLSLVDQNKIFSHASIHTLRVITYCGVAIALMYTAGLPYIFSVADRDDAPGVMLIGCIFVAASVCVAVGASLFKNLLSHVVEMKSENELTV